MNVYNVKIRDSSEDVAFKKAKEMLLAFPKMFAAIYGYTRDGKKTVWLLDPIMCKSQEELLANQKRLNAERPLNKVILHTLFRQNVEGQ